MVHKRASKELLVVWKQAKSRQRYLIGRLWAEGNGYRFRYVKDQPRSVQDALDAGFRLFDAFPQIDGEWQSETLFPLFRRRLPRREVLRSLEAQGIDTSDPLEVLRVTGGRVPTDTLEFLEPVDTIQRDGGELEYTVRFPIAGWRYYSGEVAISELAPGEKLRLELQEDNPYDASAIRILSPSGAMLGYVPAIYSVVLDTAVMREQYEARIEKVGSADDPQTRVVVRFRGVASPLDKVRLVSKDMDKYVAALM